MSYDKINKNKTILKKEFKQTILKITQNCLILDFDWIAFFLR